MLYDIDEIKEFYKSCEFSTYMPNYIPIGGDYGEFKFVIKSGANEVEFGIIDEGAIGSSTVENLQNFNKWYINCHNLSDLLGQEKEKKKVTILLKKKPDIKILLKIKKVFNLNISSSELIKLAENIPNYLSINVFDFVAERIIFKNDLSEWLEIK